MKSIMRRPVFGVKLFGYHSAAPNTATRPRQMVGKGVLAVGARVGSTDDDHEPGGSLDEMIGGRRSGRDA